MLSNCASKAFLLAALVVGTAACTQSLPPPLEDPVFGPIQYQIPAELEEFAQPFTVSADGPGIQRVFFLINAQVLMLDDAAPFEYEIDPLSLDKGTYELEVVAQGFQEDRVIVNFVVTRDRPPLAEIAAAIAALQPGEWYEIPETQMRDVDLPFGHGRGDQGAIIGAKSGGCWDSKRQRLVVWGSGGDVLRNEVTVFDMATYEWTRLNDPSPFPDGRTTNTFGLLTHTDGAPVSRHSFGQIHYIPMPVDRMFIGGGLVESAGFKLDHKTYTFDFDTLTWTSGVETDSTGTGTIGAVAPDGRVWQHGGEGFPANLLSVIDVVAQTNTPHVNFFAFFNANATADIDAVNNDLVSVGNGVTRRFDLDNPDVDSVVLPTTGATELENVESPGFAFHPPSGLFIGWGGGKAVYEFDPATSVWTKVDGAATGDDPGPQASRGTLGRWRFIPSLNLFIQVSSVDRNVFVYRYSN